MEESLITPARLLDTASSRADEATGCDCVCEAELRGGAFPSWSLRNEDTNRTPSCPTLRNRAAPGTYRAYGWPTCFDQFLYHAGEKNWRAKMCF